MQNDSGSKLRGASPYKSSAIAQKRDLIGGLAALDMRKIYEKNENLSEHYECQGGDSHNSGLRPKLDAALAGKEKQKKEIFSNRASQERVNSTRRRK